jgi:hypothetical protein
MVRIVKRRTSPELHVEIVDLMQSRQEWRKLIEEVKSHPGM